MNAAKSKILIVDDNPGNIDFLLELLNAYEVRVVTDGKGALDMVRKGKPDLILMDVGMPGIDGFETCIFIKSNPETEDIPVIFLSAKTDSESIIKAFDVGGVDYITKPYRAKEVLVRIQTQLKLKNAIKLLENMARVDSMTGIANRRRFFEVSKIRLSAAQERNYSLFLFLFDLDKFKLINDTYGHNIGDEVIKHFVGTVKTHLDPKDCFARLGGDEFVLLLSNISREKALLKIEKVRKAIASITSVADVNLHISVSIGATMAKPSDKEIDSILKRADKSMYDAKKKRQKS